mmetsp:Transcript_5176/g.11242  ORF Transcript_5176/g.11242 Transcript_5176/m.11242 type:complete len:169 (-) Transcript_5176:1271-1777(-)|eukprot:CAMPEP_0183780920 /NCGR_PEP_ID=MMETSP0739-20130205/57502_1 /TAXON_ID=385413 /ORGANISM="Thalassiosira miniscula, Strain CCMP1093" /LENGTH=168 /DNA_ID=CAMNT_0026023981 /DNA_START=75 /DNA_END=581 /DNA_ORIENTATION=+
MSDASIAPRPRTVIARRSSLDSSYLQQSKVPGAQRRCSFTTISVREYDQTVGDSPSCQDGAPLALGWNYAEQESVSLDEFEEVRKNQRRSKRSDLILGAAERRKVLVMNGATLMEILRAERLVALKNGVTSMGMQLGCNFQGQVKSGTSSNRKRCAKAPKRGIISRAA